MQVSVIVPIYNVAKYLRQCLDSLLAQDYPHSKLAIILVDDGSQDQSSNICQEYVRAQPSLFFYYRKENGGLSSARNFGLDKAQGDYVLFLDSDDYFEPDLISKLVQATNDGQKLIVESSFIWEYPNHREYYQAHPRHDLADWLKTSHVVAWNKLIKRTWLVKTQVKFPLGKLYEDQFFFFKLSRYLDDISQVGCVEQALIHYRQRQGSISYTESSRITDILWIYEDILADYQETDKFQAEIEYRFCRNLLGNVLLRKIWHIKDKKQKRLLLDQIWNFIQLNFPNWSKNPYLKEKGNVNLYLRCIKKPIYKLFYL
ncbi:MAG: glycosyltransferase [Ligilactobacillus sp.]|nr:glycosyltransferase [Ligilactobacillus sp.]